MRLRHKPWAQDLLNQHPEYVVQNAEQYKGNWQERFGNHHPIYIEVGSGKGRFITEMAKTYPDINFIAIELQTSVIVSILEIQLDIHLPNLQILHTNGSHLNQYFDQADISRIYLNFSDPWPKKKHTKRRLTSPAFLEQYQAIITANGEIHFKTDNQGLFEYSLASMSQYGMILKEVWLDLHQSDFEGNIETEYEMKFAEKGHRIYRLEAYFPNN
ncbi:tRNA (guanosine(46)-N7)-methyltransferase TrmB [Fundicoccus culcitae]|uniref:tRNA (guanine-N(7)-)-methyltransferase n=1 Tax=Fundicoccus culcitae TaxID=2969821 RepID=A0ABY5P5Y0_9LACT|nr:tRNA (guanosine(46)-N7)-methyltransferase TrmB [Fundicoccus culcitae]UUX34157.1 tRNA (guanosine(46)-N7)-methyltransferase TrmB [Fundicoccus culcitae]